MFIKEVYKSKNIFYNYNTKIVRPPYLINVAILPCRKMIVMLVLFPSIKLDHVQLENKSAC